ncbi:hypothetical protein [Bartonella sp. CM120XJJH]|uniref:hypothetical protein n=1 Tax=Bartonella sp. CM120XJJH TaxID=3243544 RepID=UPI0035CE9EF2
MMPRGNMLEKMVLDEGGVGPRGERSGLVGEGRVLGGDEGLRRVGARLLNRMNG